MADKRVLIAMPLIRETIEKYTGQFTSHDIEYDISHSDNPLTKSELRDAVNDYDGILVGATNFDRDVIEEADRLEVISKWGIGLDDIDVKAAEENNIDVVNTPGQFSDEIADVVLTYLVMLTRDVHNTDRKVRRGGWPTPIGESIKDKTLGIVGVGNIGAAVAKRASAHQLDLLGYDIEPIPAELRAETGLAERDFDDLLDESDFLSLHCPLTADTERLIARRELKKLGTDGYIINTSRGKLIHEGDLVSALRDGSIAGAALDVFEEEPLPDESPLLELDNVILGSHTSYLTRETLEDTTEKAVANLVDSLERNSPG